MSVGCRIVEKIELNEDQRKRVEKEEKQQVLEKRMKQNISAITEENKGEVVNRVQTSPTRLRDHSKVEEIRIWIDQAELHLKQVTDLEILLHCCHCFFSVIVGSFPVGERTAHFWSPSCHGQFMKFGPIFIALAHPLCMAGFQ